MLRSLLAVAVLSVASSASLAQAWPAKPIKYIVPFPPAGATDLISRPVAEKLRERLGQPVVIENIGGAGGSIGVGRLAQAPADGYVIGLGNSATHTITPNLLAEASVRPGERLHADLATDRVRQCPGGDIASAGAGHQAVSATREDQAGRALLRFGRARLEQPPDQRSAGDPGRGHVHARPVQRQRSGAVGPCGGSRRLDVRDDRRGAPARAGRQGPRARASRVGSATRCCRTSRRCARPCRTSRSSVSWASSHRPGCPRRSWHASTRK